MPCGDDKGPFVTFDALELPAPLYGLFGSGIDAAGVLVEVEGGFTHDWSKHWYYRRLIQRLFCLICLLERS